MDDTEETSLSMSSAGCIEGLDENSWEEALNKIANLHKL